MFCFVFVLCFLHHIKMAQAGFYKLDIPGESNATRCFVCFKIFSNWERNDDPFDEHLRHSANCAFANLNKSQEHFKLFEWIAIIKARNLKLNVSFFNNFSKM